MPRPDPIADPVFAAYDRRQAEPAQPLSDIERDLADLLGPGVPAVSRKLDNRLDVFDRVTVLANRTGRPFSIDELTIAHRLIRLGATNPEAVLADVRAAQAASTFEVA